MKSQTSGGVKDYDPFGMVAVGRNWESGTAYRFGFNGKEMDNETYGDGNIYDYGFRIYNPRLGKFLSVDPLFKSYSYYTPYQFAGNSPIKFIDLDGLEEWDPDFGWVLDVRINIQTQIDVITQTEQQKKIANGENINPTTRKLLDNMYESEGKYVNNPKDPGGATKYGIAQNGEWTEAAKFLGIDPAVENIKTLTKEQADKYYIHTRFETYRINEINNEKMANAVLDQSVLTPGIINKNLKKSLNDLGYDFDVNSKKLNDDELQALNSAGTEKLLDSFLQYQLEHYESIKNKDLKNYNEHIKGWKNRLQKLKDYKPK